MNNYVVYTGTFTKQDGTQRTMRFVRSQDLPQSVFSETERKNTTRKLQEGYEIVFDIERNGFRAFNWNTAQGEVVSQEQHVDFAQ
jgi:hypothetical protein